MFFRINPNSFKIGTKRSNPPFEERLGIVVDQVTGIMASIKNEFKENELLKTLHFFYDE